MLGCSRNRRASSRVLGNRCSGASSSHRIPRTTCVTSCSRMGTPPLRANQNRMAFYPTLRQSLAQSCAPLGQSSLRIQPRPRPVAEALRSGVPVPEKTTGNDNTSIESPEDRWVPARIVSAGLFVFDPAEGAPSAAQSDLRKIHKRWNVLIETDASN